MHARRRLELATLAGFAFALVACNNASTSRPVLPQPPTPTPTPSPAASNRGKIDALSAVVGITQAAMKADPNSAIITQVGGPPKCDVTLYSIDYETVGVKEEPANASAALFVPHSGCGGGPYPLIGYAHGTNLAKSQMITDPKSSNSLLTPPDSLPVVVAAIFASHGYVVVATDYLGLGHSTYPYHPYLVGDAEASAVIDALRAAKTAATKLGVPLSGKVMLTGHSQGGQAAVATQRAIEAQNASEFNLVGDAPSSGPYALTQTFVDSLHNQSQDAPILAAYVLTAYEKTYGNIYSAPGKATDVFQLPYATTIDTLLPVATLFDEIQLFGNWLPLQLSALLQPAFVTSFENDPASGARTDTAANDLLSGWKPAAPVFLCGGSKDPEVEYANAIAAQKYFASTGASVTLTDVNPLMPPSLPLIDYHVTVADFCLTLARVSFFDSLKQSAAKRHR